MINHIDFVVVLFYKENDPASKNAALDVDSIDDNLKERGISIVKTKNKDQIEMSVVIFQTGHDRIARYDIDVLPKLIYFESEIPTYWPDEVPLLGKASKKILDWWSLSSFQAMRQYYPGSVSAKTPMLSRTSRRTCWRS